MAGSVFGVSVEEAFVRSGTAEAIKNNLTSMNEVNRKILDNSCTILDNTLNEIIILKEQFMGENRLSKEYSRRIATRKKDSTKAEYGRKLSELLLLTKSHKAKLNQKIIYAFKLEHKILDILSNNQTQTALFSIYFYGENPQEIMRGEIKTSDLYNSKYLYVDNAGNIKLSAKVIQAEGLFSKITSSRSIDGVISDVVWDEMLAIDLEALVNETYSFLKDVQNKYQEIKDTASKKHLGNELDALHDVTRKFSEESNAIMSLIEEKQAAMYNYLFYDQGKKPAGRLNRGHLAEAYEHIYQARLAGREVPSAYEALQRSLGDDPWYIGGDVGNVQVKAFFDNNDRHIASYTSIISLGKTLVQVVKNTINALQEITTAGTERILLKQQSNFNKANKILEQCTRKEIETMMKNSLKQS